LPQCFRFPRHGEQVDPAFLALLEKLERESILLDSRFRVPGTGIRFGLDPLIGIIPLAGDIISAAWSLRLLAIARQLGPNPALMRKMLLIVAADFLLGLTPILGPLFDVFFRGNLRNLGLLLEAISKARASTHAG
jgi:hypothetical protein